MPKNHMAIVESWAVEAAGDHQDVDTDELMHEMVHAYIFQELDDGFDDPAAKDLMRRVGCQGPEVEGIW